MMFYQSDSDSSESESSDSEDELDFSAVLDSKSQSSQTSDEPRRVGRLRKYLLEALLAAFSISSAVRPGQGASAGLCTSKPRGTTWRRYNADVEDPWKVLEGCTGEMGRNMGDKRIKDIPEIIAGLRRSMSFDSEQLVMCPAS
jgi:hypothetical protein